MYLKIKCDKNNQYGDQVAYHLVEIDNSGNVLKYIDIDQNDNVINKSPTYKNQYGATDHPPYDMKCDWIEYLIEQDEFNAIWARQ